MNDIFDFRRFGKYFAYDLRNVKNRFGWSLLVLSLLPAMMFVFSEIFSLTIDGHFWDMPNAVRYVAVYIGLIIAVLKAPSKIWGGVTDRRYGSDWLMLPASGFEKWLSMMLICVLVLPLCLSVVILAGDAICTLVFGDAYAGRLMLSELCSLKDLGLGGDVDVDFFGIGYTSWLSNILIFTLGALCFKRSKAAKTLLVCFLVGVVFSLISAAIFGQAAFDNDSLEYFMENLGPERFISGLNVLLNVICFTVIAGVMIASYFRIKTIKH